MVGSYGIEDVEIASRKGLAVFLLPRGGDRADIGYLALPRAVSLALP